MVSEDSTEHQSILTRLSSELDAEMVAAGYDPKIQEDRNAFARIKNAKTGVAESPLDKVPAQSSTVDKTVYAPPKESKKVGPY